MLKLIKQASGEHRTLTLWLRRSTEESSSPDAPFLWLHESFHPVTAWWDPTDRWCLQTQRERHTWEESFSEENISPETQTLTCFVLNGLPQDPVTGNHDSQINDPEETHTHTHTHTRWACGAVIVLVTDSSVYPSDIKHLQLLASEEPLNTSVQTDALNHTHTHTHTLTDTYTRSLTHTHTLADTHRYTHTNKLTHSLTHTHTLADTHTHTHTHTHSLTHTHTHTQTN